MSTNNELKIENSALYELLRKKLVLPDVGGQTKQAGLVILLEGKPGTGKSTLALQLLDTIDSDSRVCKRTFYSIEQSATDVRNKYIKMIAAKLLDSFWQDQHQAKVPEGSFQGLTKSELAKLLGGLKKPLKRYWEAINQTGPILSETNQEIHRAVQEAIRPKFEKRIDFPEIPQASTGSFSRSRSKIEERLQKIVDELNNPKQLGGEGSGDRPTQLVVVDGLSLFSPIDRAALNFQQLIEVIRGTCQVGILVYEPGNAEGGSIEHHVDMIIELDERWTEKPQAYLFHELLIRKSRYQDAALGRHQYKIRDSGIEVFPSVHFQVHQPNYMLRELERSMQPSVSNESPSGTTSGTPALTDQSIVDRLANIQKGDSTVLLGPRGTFKTELCLDFLCRGDWGCDACQAGKAERSLLVSMIGNGDQTHGGLRCPVARCPRSPVKQLPHIYTFHQRPGFISPAEFLSTIRRRLEKQAERKLEKIRRFVLWDLTQVDYRFPLFGQDSMFLTALMDHLKAQGIKSLFMGAGNARYSAAASAMADNVLFCWGKTAPSKAGGIGPSPQKELILYVDRLSKDENRTADRLYTLEATDIGRSLRDKKELKRIDESDLEDPDKDTLHQIANKQGFQV